MHELSERITLGQAARLLPGHPSPSSLWRWCRRGVKARNGEQIRMRHVRVGGKLYIQANWLDEFSKRLAEADVEHFEMNDEDTPILPRCQRDTGRAERLADVNRELQEAGL